MDGNSACFTVNITDDDIYEESQSFSVALSGASPASAIKVVGGNVTKTIQDNNGSYSLY